MTSPISEIRKWVNMINNSSVSDVGRADRNKLCECIDLLCKVVKTLANPNHRDSYVKRLNKLEDELKEFVKRTKKI